MNRVTKFIASTQVAIDAKNLPAVKLAEMSSQMNIDFGDYAHYQNIKSQAFASGTINLEEAQTVYITLGSGPDHFNKQPLATKYAVTKMIEELLGRGR